MITDTSNQFQVRPGGGTCLIFRRPIRISDYTVMLPRRDALNLAAWIVALADPGRVEFDRVIGEIVKEQG